MKECELKYMVHLELRERQKNSTEVENEKARLKLHFGGSLVLYRGLTLLHGQKVILIGELNIQLCFLERKC